MRQLLVAAAVCSLIASPAYSDDAAEYTNPDEYVADCVSYYTNRTTQSAVVTSAECRINYYAYVVSRLGKPLPDEFMDVCTANVFRSSGLSKEIAEIDASIEERKQASADVCADLKAAILDGTYWQ